MFLRCTERRKDGKTHRYWSLVENRRVSGGRVTQRQVLYLGEINDSQREAWRKTIEVFEAGVPRPQTMALFPDDGAVPLDNNFLERQIKPWQMGARRGCSVAANRPASARRW